MFLVSISFGDLGGGGGGVELMSSLAIGSWTFIWVSVALTSSCELREVFEETSPSQAVLMSCPTPRFCNLLRSDDAICMWCAGSKHNEIRESGSFSAYKKEIDFNEVTLAKGVTVTCESSHRECILTSPTSCDAGCVEGHGQILHRATYWRGQRRSCQAAASFLRVARSFPTQI